MVTIKHVSYGIGKKESITTKYSMKRGYGIGKVAYCRNHGVAVVVGNNNPDAVVFSCQNTGKQPFTLKGPLEEYPRWYTTKLAV